MSNWLNGLLSGDEKKASIDDSTLNDRIVSEYSKNNLISSVVSNIDATANLELESNMMALVDEDRRKHLEDLSETNLAYLYTEMSLHDQGKSVMVCFSEEYPKSLESVKKNRKSIEDKILALVPKHNLSKKANQMNIWSVVNKGGKDSLVRMIGDPYANISDAKSTAFSLLSDLGVIKLADEVQSFGVEGETDGTIGQVLAFSASNDSDRCLLVKFANDSYWVNTKQITKTAAKIEEMAPYYLKYYVLLSNLTPEEAAAIPKAKNSDSDGNFRVLGGAIQSDDNTKAYIYLECLHSYDEARVKSELINSLKNVGIDITAKSSAFTFRKMATELPEEGSSITFTHPSTTQQMTGIFKGIKDNGDFEVSYKLPSGSFAEISVRPELVHLDTATTPDEKLIASMFRKANEVVIIREAPAAEVNPACNPMKENPMDVPSVHTSKPGEIKVVEPTTDATFMGAPQGLDNPEDKIPAVYRAPDTVPNPTKTKDFGHFQNHASQEITRATFNQENAQKYNERSVTTGEGEVTSTSPEGIMVKQNPEDPNSTIYVHTNDVIEVSKVANVTSYIDTKTKEIKTPESIGVVPGDSAPNEVDGKVKVVTDKPIIV